MKREVVWTASAEADLLVAFGNLEEGSPGRGERLMATLDRLLELLKRFPEIARPWREPVRRVPIRRSNLGLFYVMENQRLVVIALQDLRRDPDALRGEIERRLPGG